MFGIDLDTWSNMSVHAAMGLIILLQILVALKVIDLVKSYVIPLATNHFKHVEDAFNKMNEQSAIFTEETRLRTEAVKAQTEVITNQTQVIRSQGQLLRTLLREIEAGHKEDRSVQ